MNVLAYLARLAIGAALFYAIGQAVDSPLLADLYGRVRGEEPGACVIKGNVASSGEKIYHVPGQRYYEATRISLGKGERWFCSERKARQAGWRKAKV